MVWATGRRFDTRIASEFRFVIEARRSPAGGSVVQFIPAAGIAQSPAKCAGRGSGPSVRRKKWVGELRCIAGIPGPATVVIKPMKTQAAEASD
jgi:hypothetical protein